MSIEQRRALAATIPTTEVIKDAVTFPRDGLGEPLAISAERFEAWLAGVRRDAARGAIDGLIADKAHMTALLHAENGGNVEDVLAHYRDTRYPVESP